MLRSAAMALKDVLAKMDREEVERIASEAGTTYVYLAEQLAGGHRKAGRSLAKRIIEAPTNRGRITAEHLMPDLFERRAG